MNTNIPSYNTQTTTQQWAANQREDHLLLTMHSLEESSSLYSSIIDHEALDLANSVHQTENRQSVLIDRLKNLTQAAAALKKAAEVVHAEGTTLGVTGFTISAGLINLFSGNLLVGLPATLIGLNELRKIIERHQGSDTAGLIGEARTGVALIQQMEEFQLQSLDSISTQLSNAMEQLKDTEEQLTKIKDLATQGSADGEAKKQEAYRLTEQAVKEQKQAVYTLTNGRAKIEQAIKELSDIGTQLDKLIQFARDKQAEPKEIDHFINEIEGVLTQIVKAQETMYHAAKDSDEGLKILRGSVRIYAAALEKYNEAAMVMQGALYEIQKKAQMDELAKVKETLEKAQKEVAVAKERAEVNRDIAAHVEQKLVQQQQIEDNQFGPASMVMGGIIGTVAAPFVSPLLVLPAFGAGVAGAHYVRRVHRLASKFFAKQPDMQISSGTIGTMLVKYNSDSTGWGGYVRDTVLWVQGKEIVGSKTAGMVAINLGGDTPTLYRFNRNSRSELGMMDEEDIRQLDSDLRQLLKEEKLTPKQILEILDSLARVQSDNGELCLITSDCLFLRDLRAECLRT